MPKRKTRKTTKTTKAPVIVIKMRSTQFKNIFTTLEQGEDRATKWDSITIKDPGYGHDVSNNIVTVREPTNLRFRLECTDLSLNPFYPIGVAFNQIKPELLPPPPTKTEAENIERLGLDIYDPMKRIADPDKPNKHLLVVGCKSCSDGKEYKYHIFIQDGRTGAIGIIDPKIVHDSANNL